MKRTHAHPLTLSIYESSLDSYIAFDVKDKRGPPTCGRLRGRESNTVEVVDLVQDRSPSELQLMLSYSADTTLMVGSEKRHVVKRKRTTAGIFTDQRKWARFDFDVAAWREQTWPTYKLLSS